MSLAAIVAIFTSAHLSYLKEITHRCPTRTVLFTKQETWLEIMRTSSFIARWEVTSNKILKSSPLTGNLGRKTVSRPKSSVLLESGEGLAALWSLQTLFLQKISAFRHVVPFQACPVPYTSCRPAMLASLLLLGYVI